MRKDFLKIAQIKPNRVDYKDQVYREAELWGKTRPITRLSWFDSPMISRYINKSISGRADRDWLDYVKATYFRQPARLALNVGCGHGELDRLILKRELAQYIHAFDISTKAVEHARHEAEKKRLADRLHYFIADANYLEKANLADQYDLILASMSLHHFARLEKCLDTLRRHLRPGGYFIANEFVGPEHFQWSDTQLDVVNRLLACFPMELKRNLYTPDQIKHSVERPSRHHMLAHQPFEAVSSHQIIPLTRKYFKILEQKNYGGTILHLLFDGIMGNFREEYNREHAVMVRLAIESEKLLLDFGLLPHDHALLICTRK